MKISYISEIIICILILLLIFYIALITDVIFNLGKRIDALKNYSGYLEKLMNRIEWEKCK